MKVLLLYENRDFDLKAPLPWNEKELMQDLELNILLNAMAGSDEFLLEVAMKTILTGITNDLDTIIYRQGIIQDCLKNPSVIRLLYDITEGALESRKIGWFGVFSKYPSSILSDAIGLMEIFSDILKQLRQVADEHVNKFQSDGFNRFFTMLQKELSDTYFEEINTNLESLKFRDGILISYEMGNGNKGIHPRLHQYHGKRKSWWQRLFAKKEHIYTFNIHPRDVGGARALSELTNEGINLVANALAQSNDHILHFFKLLKTELAFYIGCLNLHEQLAKMQAPVCIPEPITHMERKHAFKDLYDPCLALKMGKRIIGNEINVLNKNLVIITGANQGGKSTFLRSIGVAQLMMQSGMFVPAENFQANLCNSLFTHFKREEDTTMNSGKLDEELSRMSDIAGQITGDSLLLFNESFAATNEREGSEIARQIVTALQEKNLKVFYVTHLYQFAHNFYNNNKEDKAIFLRAERQTDTTRTFKLKVAEPLQTSYGKDVYYKVFEET
ncbi:DNA mismatch repair protein MutS [Niastella vici]|uniref:DNA mismatch repair protein MutS n=1 Tax=Niastella vici TaxID=1703345 RepID=A0A1V9FPD3_9BACT|nr:DNA mismatch repair protein MutS [Niastella vici]OQP60188.1 DNA mismatch repair protein MutS [Niastella vici]